MKYLREVTPYFRKASIISEVGWELQRGFLSGAPPAVKSPQRADTRYLPLQLCHLARNFRYPDPGKLSLVQGICFYSVILTVTYKIVQRNSIKQLRILFIDCGSENGFTM